MVCPLPRSSFQSRRAGLPEQVHANASSGATVNIPKPTSVYPVAGRLSGLAGRDMAITAGARFAAWEWPSVNTAASTDIDDEALVRAAQGGDRAAFGRLYQRYVRMVHAVLLARV